MGLDSALTIHKMLSIEVSIGFDFYSFFDLLQRTGEEWGMMDLDDPDFDEAVPVPVWPFVCVGLHMSGFLIPTIC